MEICKSCFDNDDINKNSMHSFLLCIHLQILIVSLWHVVVCFCLSIYVLYFPGRGGEPGRQPEPVLPSQSSPRGVQSLASATVKPLNHLTAFTSARCDSSFNPSLWMGKFWHCSQTDVSVSALCSPFPHRPSLSTSFLFFPPPLSLSFPVVMGWSVGLWSLPDRLTGQEQCKL